VLLQLLRKKLEPGVEDWVDEGRAIGGEVLGYGGGDGDGDAGVEERKGEIEELWQWAGMAANQEARRHEWGGEFTVEEREEGVEGVVTGLKEEEEDEEEEEGKGEAMAMAMAMEDVLRFLVKGEVGG
jgi:mediator of RNA polymerase II transcription subunit 8